MALGKNLDIVVQRFNPQMYDFSFASVKAAYLPTITSLIGDRRAPWAFATLAIAFILCDVILRPQVLIAAGAAPSLITSGAVSKWLRAQPLGTTRPLLTANSYQAEMILAQQRRVPIGQLMHQAR